MSKRERKNHLAHVRLTDSQMLFLQDLTAGCFSNLSDSIRFAIDFLNVLMTKGMFVDLNDEKDIQEVLKKSKEFQLTEIPE